MVRETEPTPLMSEGPDPKIVLPTKPVVGSHIGVVTVTVKPTIWQRIKAAWKGSKS